MPSLTHLAIIPDGNRRWAKQHGLPAFFGHREGAKTTEKILTAALEEQQIPYVTFWGASLSNITKRDAKELAFLYKLFTAYFKKIAKARLVHKNEVNIRVLGRWSDYFPKETKAAIERAVSATSRYRKFHLTILLAYSGSEEMLAAINRLVRAGNKLGPVDAATIKNSLYTKNLPPVDLIIRTGREPHLSDGFMMWDAADAQLLFSDKMWPAFSAADLARAVASFRHTERRRGK